MADRSPHWDINVSGELVRCHRTTRPYETAAQIDDAYGRVQAAYTEIDRPRAVLLVDLRDARGRNDPAFEKRLAAHRKAQLTGFRRAAVLVRSAVGKMQVERLMREDGLDLPVFHDEAAALRYLQQD